MITARNGAQVASPSPTPEWGLHLLDGSIELGNLMTVVKRRDGGVRETDCSPISASARIP